MKTTLRCSNS